jgi:hypothetical protein
MDSELSISCNCNAKAGSWLKSSAYAGDTNDSTTMIVWLHKQVMAKLAANDGKLPADIKW